MVLPQIALTAACALQHAKSLSEAMTPNTQAMARTLDGGLGLIHAEALSFALARDMQRPEAQAQTKALCQTAQETGAELEALARAAYPDLPKGLFDTTLALGHAPQEARTFVVRAKAL
jgi:3-carboxy-cis,cis-muconate cycloisomerase